MREYPLASLCGLNCGLCAMHLGPAVLRTGWKIKNAPDSEPMLLALTVKEGWEVP